MATLSAADLRKDLAGILKGADLDQLSSKKVRRQLEGKYGVDLTERKKEIDQLLMELIAEGDKASKKQKKEQTTHDVKPDRSSSEANGSKDTADSDQDVDEQQNDGSDSGSDFDVPDDYDERPKKKPKLESSTKTKVNDEEYAKELQQAEDKRGGRSTRAGKKSPAKRKQANPTAKKTGGKGKGYAQECDLSPALASVIGTNRMSRCDIVKRLWQIVKERDLLDPKNKQFMICDDELYKLFKRKKIRMFAVMKYLTGHIFKPGEMEELLR